MNTDITEGEALMGSLDAIQNARSSVVLCEAIDRLARALGQRHYVLLHFHGADHELIAMHDNLGASAGPSEAWTQQLIARVATTSRIPEIIELADEPSLRHAASAIWQEGLTTCVLVLGSDIEIEPEAALSLLAMTNLAASYTARSLVELVKAECPLTLRELECLVFAAAGCSAKETSHLLQLSSRTVEEYLARCKERIGVRSTLAAAATALRRGWISFQEVDAAKVEFSRRCAEHPELRGRGRT